MLVTIRIESNGSIDFYNEKFLLHRINGPAVIQSDGTKSWWYNGKLHRLDGPAFEFIDGSKEWWINDKEYSEKEFNDIVGEIC